MCGIDGGIVQKLFKLSFWVDVLYVARDGGVSKPGGGGYRRVALIERNEVVKLHFYGC